MASQKEEGGMYVELYVIVLELDFISFPLSQITDTVFISPFCVFVRVTGKTVSPGDNSPVKFPSSCMSQVSS